jgi:endogenous inhibitor of DNA gyrase (YacG/DUF329 family)
MIDGFANPGQKPFQPDFENVSQDKNAKKRLRESSKKYYKLGMPKEKHVKCKLCGRDIGANHHCDTSKPRLSIEQVKCPKCETLVLVDATYCYCCGKWLNE